MGALEAEALQAQVGGAPLQRQQPAIGEPMKGALGTSCGKPCALPSPAAYAPTCTPLARCRPAVVTGPYHCITPGCLQVAGMQEQLDRAGEELAAVRAQAQEAEGRLAQLAEECTAAKVRGGGVQWGGVMMSTLRFDEQSVGLIETGGWRRVKGQACWAVGCRVCGGQRGTM